MTGPGVQRARLGIGLGLVLLTLILFWPATGHEFLNLDDDRYVAQNPHLDQGLSPAGIAWAMTTDYGAVWIPATWTSFLADLQFFGPDPAGFHRTNVLLHAANVLLLFLVLHAWTGAVWRSALAAAFFAVHPLSVEPVAWVTGRKDVLFMFFSLGSLWAWLGWTRDRKWMLYGAAFFLAVLALMAKPMAVVLPVIMIILTRWPTAADDPRPDPRRLAISLIPFVLASFAVALVAHQFAAGGKFGVPLQVPLIDRLGRAAIFAVTHLKRILWPAGLCITYPLDPVTLLWPARMGAVGLLIGITVGAWWARHRAGWLMSGWAWFLVTLLPVLDVVQGGQQLTSDRYVYLPAIGIYVAASWALEWISRRRPLPRWLPAAVCAVLVMALAWSSAIQLKTWRNNETAYTRALAVTKDNDRAHLNLATHLDETGSTNEALQHARRSVAIRETGLGYYQLGNILLRLGRTDQARRAYENALLFDHGLAEAHSNLGMIDGGDGRPAEAEGHFRRAIELDPDLVVARYNLAQLLAALGRVDEARTEVRAVLERDPAHSGACELLAHLNTQR